MRVSIPSPVTAWRGRAQAYARDVIAHRQTRVAASASVLLAFIGLWAGHTLEYLRVWGGAGLVSSITNPVHIYMLPLAGVLVLLSALFALRLWRAWEALNQRLEHAVFSIRGLWRGSPAPAPEMPSRPSSPGARLVAIWLPLASAQIVLYVIQENIEAIARAQPAPWLGAITGIHWAAPLVHLYVALLLACGTRICQILVRRRVSVVERAEALVVAIARRVRTSPPETPTPARQSTAPPLDGIGAHLWRRPPPRLLDA